MKMCILMNQADNVATVLEDIEAGEQLEIVDKDKNLLGVVTAIEKIPFAHKICVCPIEEKEVAIKFGVIIGRATKKIPVGGYAHIHNIISIKGAEEILDGEVNER